MQPAEQKRICFDSYAICCFDRKDTKSNPLTRKTAYKRLNINYFKERLVHFNGTVVISKYGVFAIETKNYRGEIYGDDNRKEWTQMIITDVTYVKKWWKTYTYVTKSHFYNPVKQSLAHSIAIKSLLSEWSALKVVPIIVFTGTAVLKDVTSSYHVVYDFNLLETVLGFSTIFLTDNDVKRVVDILLQNNVREFVDDRSHVNNIYATKAEEYNKVALGICPKCGGNLVMRTGKYGTFYGCSNYPKCKFTTH